MSLPDFEGQNYSSNIMGNKLLLNFGAKFQRQFQYSITQGRGWASLNCHDGNVP